MTKQHWGIPVNGWMVASLALWSIISSTCLSGDVQGADLTEEEALELGIDAYLYFLSADKHGCNTAPNHQCRAWPRSRQGPANQFSNIRAYPPADFRVVVRPNFDTLYRQVG